MSVVTKRGDEGETDLLFGRKISKTSDRMVAIGAVDELNACLGLARVSGLDSTNEAIIDQVQECLVGLMGELAVLPEDAGKYVEAGYPRVDEEIVTELTEKIQAIEASGISFEGWVRPGASGNAASAHLDLARTICRRAEREVWNLEQENKNPEIARYLNRVSDLMWVMARKIES